MDYEVIVVGTSAGGIEALKTVLGSMQVPCSVPVVIVQHLSPRHESYLPSILSEHSGHKVVEVCEKEFLQAGVVYVAPPNYHVLIEKDGTFSLSVEKRVSYARPSIDVLFETAADAFKNRCVGVLLTGANHDGAKGLYKIMENGGYTVVQSPETAYAPEMPISALKALIPDIVLPLEQIGPYLDKVIRCQVDRVWEKSL